MMERRILKDFQIGIVESIVNEVVKNTTESRDVFSSIAKAINKRSASRQYVIHSMNICVLLCFFYSVISACVYMFSVRACVYAGGVFVFFYWI